MVVVMGAARSRNKRLSWERLAGKLLGRKIQLSVYTTLVQSHEERQMLKCDGRTRSYKEVQLPRDRRWAKYHHVQLCSLGTAQFQRVPFIQIRDEQTLCNGPNNKYFWPCEPCGFCHNYSTLPLQLGWSDKIRDAMCFYLLNLATLFVA